METSLGYVPVWVGSVSGRSLVLAGRWIACIGLLTVAGCATAPSGKPGKHSKIDPIWGVEAPKKMVADGDPVPPGGGRYQVGKPYMVGGRMYYPREDVAYDKTGMASWYGSDFHGRETANGEVYDKDSISAAHTTLPIPSYARVTNLDNGRSIIVRVNDRGPYVGNRLIDVSERTADMLGFKRQGLSHVRVQYVSRAPVEGSDQRMLVASLRGPGGTPNATQDRTLIAQNDRQPSDGRVTALAAERLAPLPAASAKPRPIVLASAVADTLPRSPAMSPQPKSPALGLASLAPLPPQRPTATPKPVAARQPAPNTIAGVLGTLPADSVDDVSSDAPQPRPAAFNAVAGTRKPVALPASAPLRPSRYGPNGTVTYPSRPSDATFYAPGPSNSPANDAIARLLDGADAARAARIDLGAYGQAATATRVADLMRPYGDVRLEPVRSGLGEELTLVTLTVPAGQAPGQALADAERLGIRAAAISQ